MAVLLRRVVVRRVGASGNSEQEEFDEISDKTVYHCLLLGNI
jgi:hypothetical protein